MTTSLQKNRLRHVFPSAFGDVDSLIDQFLGPDTVRSSGSWRAPATIWEAEDKFHVELDVPGVKEENVELTYDKGTLTISLEREAPAEQQNSWHNERLFGKLRRSLSLPESADPESISAELNAGVLHVTIDKRPEAQPKRISVKAV